MAEKIEDSARAEAIAPLTATGWTYNADRDAIEKTFKFGSFVDAFGWMAQVAIHAEKADHHPEWSNVYNRVEVLLTTHDAGGLTKLDLALAAKMDAAAP
jgi:4a-hydroxytetrahydrobiopterin dehydratase